MIPLRTELDAERARKARLHREGCPPGFEAEWETSGKFRMMVAERNKQCPS